MLFAGRKQYFNPDDKDDCFQTGLVALLAHRHNFNPEKYNNTFAYFTEIFKRGIAEGFNQLHNKRGVEKGERLRTISINTAN